MSFSHHSREDMPGGLEFHISLSAVMRHVLCFVMNKQLIIHDKAIACS